jgi:hypothetical protein
MSTAESAPHIYQGQPYARVDLNPMPESTLSPSQGLWIWPLAAAIVQAGKHHDQVSQEASVSILCVLNPSDRNK